MDIAAKLRKVEALARSGATAGEREAAMRQAATLRARLAAESQACPAPRRDHAQEALIRAEIARLEELERAILMREKVERELRRAPLGRDEELVVYVGDEEVGRASVDAPGWGVTLRARW